MADPISATELAELLVETGRRHHAAYIDSDGVDPEWPLWYAGYLQARLWDRGGSLPSRSLLVHLLLTAEADHGASDDGRPWPEFYAELILGRLSDPSR